MMEPPIEVPYSPAVVQRLDRMTLTVQGLDSELRGWADVDEVRVRIPGALPGDEARIRIEAVSRHRPEAWASLRGIGEGPTGLDQRAPQCEHAAPLAGKCGGCPGLHVPYSDQLEAKAEALAELLAPLGLEGDPPEVEPSPKISRWRNRTNHVVRRPSKGRPRLGSRAPRTGEFATMDACMAVRPPIAGLADRIAGFLKPAQGLRYVSVRVNRKGEALVELIAYDLEAEWVEPLVAEIFELSAVLGVAGSDNDQPGNALRVAPVRTLAGESTLAESFGAVTAYVTADAFLQLNPEVADGMYGQVAQWAAAANPTQVTDLYCGVGPLGLTAAHAAGAALIGVEVHPASEALAQRAAKDAGVQANFITAGLDAAVPAAALSNAEFVTVNPPRRGLDEPVRQALAGLSEGRTMAYMSCSPKSFTRDVLELTAAGWRLTDLSAWDMIPNTPHVELLGRLER